MQHQEKSSDRKNCWPKNNFMLKILSSKQILIPEKFWVRNNFGYKIFYNSNKFFDQNFLDHKEVTMSLSSCVFFFVRVFVVMFFSLEHSKLLKPYVLRVSQRCVEGVSRMFQGCSKGVPMVFKGCPKVV